MTIPIRDLKNTTEISTLCHQSKEPITITKNGYDDMVIMSSEFFDAHKEAFYHSIYALKNNDEVLVAEDNAFDEYNKNILKPAYTIPKIKQILDPILKKYEVSSCILFGSYAKGNAKNNSDIDLVIDCKERGLKFFGLLEDICSSFSVSIDLIPIIDIRKGTDFEKEIQTSGIVIYTKY